MYPTPPSLEHNPDHEAAMEDSGVVHLPNVKQEQIDENLQNHDLSYSLKDDTDCSEYPVVYRPSTVAPFIISDTYKPLLDLPSKMDKELALLPNGGVYNPSWQTYHPPDKKHSVMQNTSSQSTVLVPPQVNHVLLGPSSGPRIGLSPISPLTTVDVSHRGPSSVGPASIGAVPANYELPSPTSNNSSYFNKTLPSVEPPAASFFHVPETNALMANIILQDSSINLFKDHNFDSCTMCVCNNNNEKVVGNIRGSDGSLYLPPSQLSAEEEFIACSCGYSAVVNRKLAYQSGLFYEDEVDLTGLHEKLIIEPKKSLVTLIDGKNADTSDISGLDDVPQFIFELVQSQSLVTLCTPCSVLCKAISVYQSKDKDCFNAVEYSDGNEIAYLALEQSRLDYSNHHHSHEYDHQRNSYNRQCVMHKWVYLQVDGPACSQDMVRCMKALQPYLQEAIQKKRSTRLWEPVYNVAGFLTWRQFHRMAPRGTEDMAEPLPIPVLLTGHDKDWLSVAPHSIRHWEKLLLEPYSQSRNIAYVVVSPDNSFVLNHIRNFFKELSSSFEICRLGKHAPIRRALVDGIMRVNRRSASKVANESIDQWFNMLGDSPLFSKLKTYSQICCHILAPHLATLNLDKSLFESGGSRPADNKQTPSPMPPPSCGDGPSSANNLYASPSMNSCENEPTPVNNMVGSTPAGFGPGSSLVEVDEDESPPPAIMVYLIDPFTVGEDEPDVRRLITLGLMRCFKTMIDKLPESMQNHVHVQIISLESILELANESHDKGKRIDQLKALAFSVFTQCRRILTHTSNVRSLTGFGPASVFDQFLKPEMEHRSLNPYGVFFPAYILAPVKESKSRHKEAEEALGDPREKSTVIYCTYCLSEDQRWLLATATDDLGEILETACINIEIPNRTRRRKASSRRHGLRKLMDWILGIMSIGVNPWRLVIGRMGRMGHGELKGWWTLLSRKSLAMASKSLKEMCAQCNYLFPGDAPCILSACVVSMEPDSAFRMMPDMFTPDERFGQNSKNCNLSTPQDTTCTHILVFPTSATAQSAQRFQDDSTFNFEEEGDINFIEGEEIDGMGGGMGIGSIFHDIFSEDNAPTQDIDNLDDGSCQPDSLSQPGSPHLGGGYSRSSSNYSGQARSNGIVMADPQEDFCGSGLQQQPLALGYYVSTASTGSLPHWFWSSCPHLQYTCPTFLKSALHLNQPAVTQAEDYMHTATIKVHPLDSTCTADVLRFVLEGYNSLSWLVLDPATQDRRSCLPLHMQALSHLYNIMASLI